MVIDASTDYAAGSTDALRNRRVERFDFAGLVSRYDAARAVTPTLSHWSVASALASVHQGGSDTAAFGGDFAYQYGHAGDVHRHRCGCGRHRPGGGRVRRVGAGAAVVGDAVQRGADAAVSGAADLGGVEAGFVRTASAALTTTENAVSGVPSPLLSTSWL